MTNRHTLHPVASGLCGGAGGAAPGTAVGLDQAFDAAFGDLTGRIRDELDAGNPPVIVRLGDDLIFRDGSESTTLEVTGPEYHRLKRYCHLPLVTYLTLVRSASGREDAAALQRQLANLAPTAEDPDAVCVADILAACSALCRSRITTDAPLGHEAVRAFVTRLRPAFNALTGHAAELEVRGLADGMHTLCQEQGDERLARAYFVVCGGPQPRYRELSKQFFRRWLDRRPGVGAARARRIVYAENATSLDDALDRVVEQLANERLGEVFLDSPLDLNQDVLGDAASRAIDDVFGAAG